MLKHYMGLIYVLTLLLGIACIVLVLLLGEKNYRNNTNTHIPLQNFVFNTFYVCIASFLIYYIEYIVGSRSIHTAFRLIDYFCWALLFYYWVKYISSSDFKLFEKPLKIIRISSFCFCSLYIFIWSVSSIAVSADLYLYEIFGLKTFMYATQITFTLFIGFICAISMFKIFHSNEESITLAYISTSSVIFITYSVSIFLEFLMLYKGLANPMPWMFFPINITPLFIFSLYLTSLFFIYRHGFLPEFFGTDETSSDNLSMPLQTEEILLSEYNFTSRETEILFLIIKGYKNNEIAEQLFISENTVKHHVYNIFRKSNVNDRIELICLFQNKNLVI